MKSKHGKSVAFHTLGCKVNQYDTQAMQEKFIQNGYNITEFDQIADVYVINTCTVTSLGDRKSRQMIRRANRLNLMQLLLLSVHAQTAAKEILNIPGVDLVLGTRDRNDIVQLVEKARNMDRPIDAVQDIMQVKEFEEMPITTYEDKTRAVLKIQEGCDRYCSYCIIPYARGPVRSRRPMDVIRQVNDLVNDGFQEFVLTGIHVASYGKDLKGVDLLSLIKEIHGVEGVKRIRLGSLEPTLITEDFVREIKNMPKVCSHYHLSLQSGNDLTLERMNRKYTTRQYREIVDRLRRHISDVAITTDIMVGFPGETEEDFMETIDVVKKVGFDNAFTFLYSKRAGTPAANMECQVDENVAKERFDRLLDEIHASAAKAAGRDVNSVKDVLVEEVNSQNEDLLTGRLSNNMLVHFPGDKSLIGEIIPVYLEESKGFYYIGKQA